jgi:hypothetical protein
MPEFLNFEIGDFEILLGITCLPVGRDIEN